MITVKPERVTVGTCIRYLLYFEKRTDGFRYDKEGLTFVILITLFK